MDWLITVVQSGLASLASYLATHVLLCLVPAFFIAGGLSALVPQQSIIRSPSAPMPRSGCPTFAAAGAGSLLAVCSCTIQPLFAGIYKKGAASARRLPSCSSPRPPNILALSYTGVPSVPTLRLPDSAGALVRHRHRHDHGGAVPPQRACPAGRQPDLCRRRGGFAQGAAFPRHTGRPADCRHPEARFPEGCRVQYRVALARRRRRAATAR